MENVKKVSHEGIVERIEGDKVFVKIISKSACSKCHIKSVCMPGDRAEKIISANFEGNIITGDNVNVTIEEKFSWIAVFFSYILPFIVLIASFLISLQIVKNDIISSIVGLGMLIPYYAVLFLFKRSFQKRFLFKAVKI